MSSLLSVYGSLDQGHMYNMCSNLPATKAFLGKIAPAQNIFFFFLLVLILVLYQTCEGKNKEIP